MQCAASCPQAACSAARSDAPCCSTARAPPAQQRSLRGCSVPLCRASVLRLRAADVLAFANASSSARPRRRTRSSLRVHASGNNGAGPDTEGKPEFGYTRKDIILIGGGLIGFGFAMYYGLQAGGVDPLVAGNFVQLFVILGICLGYISTYFIRVANKDMTYVKQLKDYENAVMAKRLEEMPETEKERLAAEVAAERAATDERKRRALENQS